MKRILLLLALLPSLAGATDCYLIGSGNWTNPAIWSPSVPTSSDSVYMTNSSLTVTSSAAAVTIQNLYHSGGTSIWSVAAPPRLTVVSNLVFSSGYIFSGSGADSQFRVVANNADLVSLTGSGYINRLAFSQAVVVVNTNAIPANGNTVQYASTGTFVFASMTVTSSLLYVWTKDLVVSNCNVYFRSFNISTAGGSWLVTNASVNVDTTGEPGFGIAGATTGTVVDSTINDARVNGTPAGVMVLNNSTYNLGVRSAVAWNRTVLGGNGTINFTLASTPVLSVNSNILANVKILSGVNLGAALSGNGYTSLMLSNIVSRGYAITTPTNFTLYGSTLTNSTITASGINWISGNNNMTGSVVRLLSGASNLTNYWRLSVVGAASLTNANINIASNLYSEASTASLNLSGGTLTVTGQSLFAGTISNGVIGASAPVTAERAQGVSGRINSIEQMGAE